MQGMQVAAGAAFAPPYPTDRAMTLSGTPRENTPQGENARSHVYATSS